MKFVFVYVLVLFYVFEINCGLISEYKTVIECDPQDKDILLFNRHLEDTGSFWTVKHRTIVYPEDGNNSTVIHCIKAIDNVAATSSKGGKIKIRDGGVGQSFVVLEIISKRGYGYNYDIEIFGQKV